MKRASTLLITALVALAVHCNAAARLRENTNDRALVVVNDCTGDCTGASASMQAAAAAQQQQDVVPEFVPTHEWQDILPNQALPPVRPTKALDRAQRCTRLT